MKLYVKYLYFTLNITKYAVMPLIINDEWSSKINNM